MGAVSAGLAIYNGMNQWSSSRNQAIAYNQTLANKGKEAIMNMNYAFQNYELQRQDSFDSAIRDIEKVRFNAISLQSAVDASISEAGMEDSRTGKALSRAGKADTARAISSIKQNYLQASNEIDLNKEATLLSTVNYTKSLQASKQDIPGLDSLFTSIAGQAVGVYDGYKTGQVNKVLQGSYTNGVGSSLGGIGIQYFQKLTGYKGNTLSPSFNFNINNNLL